MTLGSQETNTFVSEDTFVVSPKILRFQTLEKILTSTPGAASAPAGRRRTWLSGGGRGSLLRRTRLSHRTTHIPDGHYTGSLSVPRDNKY